MEKLEMKLVRPFGPSVIHAKIPVNTVETLNKYIDGIVTDKKKSVTYSIFPDKFETMNSIDPQTSLRYSQRFKKSEIQTEVHEADGVNGILDKYFNSIVIEPGSIGSNKAADINKDIEFDPLTEKDREAIKIGLKNDEE